MSWLCAAAALAVLAPRPDASVGEGSDLLPADTPIHLAWQSLAEHFGGKSMLSEIAIVFERRDRSLSSEDMEVVQRVADELGRVSANDPAARNLPGSPFGRIAGDISQLVLGFALAAGDANRHVHRAPSVVARIHFAEPPDAAPRRRVHLIDQLEKIRLTVKSRRTHPGRARAISPRSFP